MTAVLCHHFGLKQIEIAEDIASETFLKAAEEWSIHGIPNNSTAWLYTVAKNKAKDHLKRLNLFETQIKDAIKLDSPEDEIMLEYDFTEQTIQDSQLAMIFAVCNPINSNDSQICLALQILCGFSVEEISEAFLTKRETIKKRLSRARTNLRNDKFQIKILDKTNIQLRLHTVLNTLYLLYNEGYFSSSSDHIIRKDLCLEAMRLTLLLTENHITNTTTANALLALMCFQSSRLDARVQNPEYSILYDKQDRSLWDIDLIEKGNYYLVNACSGIEVSKYHLEAAIAYWHTTSTGEDKWKHILYLYNQLLVIEYSPITALSRTFAFAKVFGNEMGIKETKKLNLINSPYYHSLLGYLYSKVNLAKAIKHYKEAIKRTKAIVGRKTIKIELERLERM